MNILEISIQTPEDAVTALEEMIRSRFRSAVTADGCFIINRQNNTPAVGDSYEIIYADNALKTGKVCVSIRLSLLGESNVERFNGLVVYAVSEALKQSTGMTRDDFLTTLDKFDFIRFSSSEIKSKEVFNPLRLSAIKPLKTMPKKMTRTHLIKALANGQFSNLTCDHALSDDYASDVAYEDVRTGSQDGVTILEDVIKYSGYQAYFSKENEVHFSLHSNQVFSFDLVIENRYETNSSGGEAKKDDFKIENRPSGWAVVRNDGFLVGVGFESERRAADWWANQSQSLGLS